MSTAVIGLIGAIIGSIPGIIIAWISKRSEDRRHFRELVMRAAIEDWKCRNAIETSAGKPLIPLDGFIIRTARIIDQIESGRSMNETEVRNIVHHALEAQYAAEDETYKYYREKFGAAGPVQ
jgi:hypothetical protein